MMHPKLAAAALLAVFGVAAGHGQDAWWVRVTGDDVYLRVDADANSQIVDKVARGTLLRAVEHIPARGDVPDGWYRVIPPEGSFCLVAESYVQRGPGNSGTVTVSSGNLRVRAGSRERTVDPYTSHVFTLLPDGERVQIVGQSNEFYMITPPPGVTFCISDRYAESTTDTTPAQPAPPAAATPSETASPAAPVIRPETAEDMSASSSASYPPLRSSAVAPSDQPPPAQEPAPLPPIRTASPPEPRPQPVLTRPADTLDPATDTGSSRTSPPPSAAPNQGVRIEPLGQNADDEPDWPVVNPSTTPVSTVDTTPPPAQPGASPMASRPEPAPVQPALQPVTSAAPVEERGAPAPPPGSAAPPSQMTNVAGSSPAATPPATLEETQTTSIRYTAPVTPPTLTGTAADLATAAQGVLRPSKRLPASVHGLRYGLFDPVTRRATIYVEFPSDFNFDAPAVVGKYVGVRGPMYRDPATQAPIITAQSVTVVTFERTRR